jgi:alkanesulfonate monooxygenase SsuD/methylene tetrahydromethanopterin reductase-like flavin-dependent oxidoreductase (luciferase family)
MRKLGFLSFGHWTPSPQSQTQTAADALLQSIDLAVEAERLGMDGALLSGSPLRSATGVTVSAARGGRSQNEKNRDRHRRNRHAV